MSAIKKGKIDWKTVKTGKKQERENDGTGFSMHLEGTIWHGQETGAPPSKRSARPPKDLAPAARAQTRGGPVGPKTDTQAPATHVSQTRPLARAQATPTP